MVKDSQAEHGAGSQRGFSLKLGGLGWRILLSLTLLSLGPLLVVSYQGYSHARQAVVDIQSTHLRSILDSKIARMKTWLTEIKANLALSASLPDTSRCCLVRLDTAGEDEFFRKCCMIRYIGIHNCCFTRIETLSHDWKSLTPCTSGQCAVSKTLPLTDAFKSSIAGSEKIAISIPFKSTEDQYSVYMGLKVHAEEPENETYIVSELRLSGCVAYIFNAKEGLGDTGKVYLLSQGGQRLTPGHDGRSYGNAASWLPPDMLDPAEPRTPTRSIDYSRLTGGKEDADSAEDSSGVFVYSDAQGKKVLGSSALIPEIGWRVVAEIDQDEAFAWLGVLRARALLTAVLTLVLLLVLAGWISGRLSRPMRELARVARLIASGHSDERIGPIEGAEADEVGKAFNAMMDTLEANKKRLQQASALAAVGELSTSMVHEMRNPLSSVKMNLKALRRQVEGNPDYMELSDIALTQAARLEKMLTDLLNYGKPMQLQPTQIRFDEVAADVEEVVRSFLEEKNVSFEIRNQLNGTSLIGDKEQIWRALSNLVVNAIQAVSPGGRVCLSASHAGQEQGFVALTVEDDGPGVAEPIRENIFQPFFTTRESGTGLGLANVKKIAEHHGGRIELISDAGRGAKFVLYMPSEEDKD
ncbi:MAG: ATP-binding protein [Planctomycetota bacterium]